ncbi:DUF1657 domain-containing protein [Salipaludibacillus aurantiacus]|uniref:DUF1657 domain-containing protein n=1 Tax=Salipaludibacillus aurantiacus TaxID=1601833 RepID=A0A1H9TW13_9BACI|nr:DUF1657 domain-containing protein [Salipaludibacillus aurantiacus]SES00943.1 Protein of unknown function [Salipaludibacillus aurantiacus]
MSVGSQVQGTLVSLQSIEATLLTLAAKSSDDETKETFLKSAERTKAVLNEVQKRKMQIENEEPQYQQE